MDETKKPKKETARQALLRVFGNARCPMAVHELGRDILAHSENALATEISTMAREGILKGKIRYGFKYKEWELVQGS